MDLLKRAQGAGFKAIAFTVDMPHFGQRLPDMHFRILCGDEELAVNPRPRPEPHHHVEAAAAKKWALGFKSLPR